MFHIIESQPVKLKKAEPSIALFLIPLAHNQIVCITDDNVLTVYHLAKCKIIEQIVIPDKPRKVIPLNNDTLVLLVPEKQSIFELSIGKGPSSIQIIHQFKPITHNLLPRNHYKEKQFFSTMHLQSFFYSDSFYIQEQSPQARKCCIRFFKRQKKQWFSKDKDLGLNYMRIEKLNEMQTLAIFASCVQANNSFKFRTLNLETLEEEQIQLQSPSFTEFSIVISIKQFKEFLYLQINKKNPEFICFSHYIEKRAEEMTFNALWVISLGSLVFDLCFSDKEQFPCKLEMRRGVKLMGEVYGKFQNINVNGQGLLIQYQKEKQPSSITFIRTHRPVKKDKLYLKLLTKGFSKAKHVGEFFNEVLYLLDTS